MPTYAYKCDHCDHEFDLFQSITAEPIRKCPKCHKMKVRRLIGTGAGILFKGSGFYCTDYRSDSYKKTEQAEAPKIKDKSPETKTDAGDAAKTGSDSKGTTEKKATA